MRTFGLLATAACISFSVFCVRVAGADPMDPALERLVTSSSCVTAGRYVGGPACSPDNAAFKRLVNQYGFALAPTAMHPARTTGYGGFHISLEGSFTKIDDGADYWKLGTQGPTDPSTNLASIRNKNPDSVIQVYMLKLRKGLPLGFELTANVGYVAHTSILTGGADFRWSLFEGFRSGIPGILPDLAIGAGVRTITGTPELQLTVASADAQISKPIPIAESSVVTPYIGYQFIRIFGDSGLIDASPNTDPLGYCGYQGPNIPGTPGARPPYTGQPVCSNGGSVQDFNNTFVFDPARITRHRLIAGINYRYEMLMISGQFMPEIIDAVDANSGSTSTALAGTPRQWTLAFDAGVIF
jgi:hypothetical protein